MTAYTFDTTSPIKLAAEFVKGTLDVAAADVDTTHIEIEGEDADRLVVEQRGDEVRIVDPRTKGMFTPRSSKFEISVTMPAHSQLRADTGSADVRVDGPLLAVWAHTGSGDIELGEVTEHTEISTGSGDVRAARLGGATKLKTGSGDIEIDTADGPVTVTTGSGDLRIGTAAQVVSKTGSGDIEIGHAEGEVRHSTGSGDLRLKEFTQGKVTVKGASSDVQIGIPDGTPVWTEITTVSGDVHSSLSPVGAPAEGQPYVEVRVTTASGDIDLIAL